MASALINRLNRHQLKHRFSGFVYAVIKKYSEDNTGYQAILITYYGFMALFPLLIVAVTFMQLLLKAPPGNETKDYFDYQPLLPSYELRTAEQYS